MKTKDKSFLFLTLVFIATLGVIALAIFGIGSKHLFGYEGIKLGLDLRGGVLIAYEADKENPTSDDMNAAVKLLQGRLDRKGWTESEVSKQGEKRIRVEIPGINDADAAVKEIGQTAQLKFLGPDGELILNGTDVTDAHKEVGDINNTGTPEPYVSLKFNANGAKAFGDATTANVGKTIYIVLDTTTISAATVNTAITNGEAVISGGFGAKEAEDLASLIRAGALPFDLKVLEMQQIGARLGSTAIDKSIIAGIVGIVCVLLFIITIYRVSGVAAGWALILHTALVFNALSLFGVTLTLPGIAGMILSVGMSVDANVIIFERFNEEMKTGKSIRAALEAAFKRAFPAIFDSNITTIIAGVVLFYLGTGPIKGFAQTLIIGVVLSLFTSLTVTRLILRSLVGIEIKHPNLYGRIKMPGKGDDTNA